MLGTTGPDGGARGTDVHVALFYFVQVILDALRSVANHTVYGHMVAEVPNIGNETEASVGYDLLVGVA